MYFKYFFSCCFKCFLATPMMMGSSFIYRGDLLSLPEDGTITEAIKVTGEFAAYLQDKQIKYNRITGHHGNGSITPGIFNAVITALKN